MYRVWERDTNTSCRTVGVMGELSAYGHGPRANFFMLSEYSTNATAGFWGREREAQIMYLNGSSMQAHVLIMDADDAQGKVRS